MSRENYYSLPFQSSYAAYKRLCPGLGPPSAGEVLANWSMSNRGPLRWTTLFEEPEGAGFVYHGDS